MGCTLHVCRTGYVAIDTKFRLVMVTVLQENTTMLLIAVLKVLFP